MTRDARVLLLCVIVGLATVISVDSQPVSPMVSAIEAGDLAKVKELVEQGEDVNSSSDEIGESLLQIAARCGRDEIVEYLISRGADVNAEQTHRFYKGMTALHCAANKHITEMLIEHGADVMANVRAGYTPLCFAANKDIAEALIAHGAEVEPSRVIVEERPQGGRATYLSRSWRPYGPLHFAAFYGRLDVAETLLAKGADINGSAYDPRFPPLHCAIMKWRTPMIDFLISHGASVDQLTSGTRRLMDFERSIYPQGANRSNPPNPDDSAYLGILQQRLESIIAEVDPAARVENNRHSLLIDCLASPSYHRPDIGRESTPSTPTQPQKPQNDEMKLSVRLGGTIPRVDQGADLKSYYKEKITTGPLFVDWTKRYRAKGHVLDFNVGLLYGEKVDHRAVESVKEIVEDTLSKIPPYYSADPAVAFRTDYSDLFTRYPGMYDDDHIHVLDMNNDGIPDILIARTETFGNAGGSWSVCMGTPDGRYYYFLDLMLGFGPRDVIPQKRGQSIVTYYWHMSASSGYNVRLLFSEDNVELLDSTYVTADLTKEE